MKIFRFEEYVTESLPQQHSVDQLKMVRKISKSTDIGDKIEDMNKQGANIHYIQNPIDSGIESMQDYDKDKDKDFDEVNSIKNFKLPTTYSIPQNPKKISK